MRKICLGKVNHLIQVKILPVGFNLSLSKDVMTFNLTDPKYSNSNKLYGQEYEGIKLKAIQSDTLFEDEFFPPNKYSLSYTGLFDGVDIEYLDINWIRATDLFKNAEFIKNGSGKNDVNQGQLGDCWFLCSLAVIAEREELFKKVVPGEQDVGKNYCGAFLFRFWRWGKWIDVVVDDFIPVFNGQPLFTHSDGVMWPLLLEKAFAKLHGSWQKTAKVQKQPAKRKKTELGSDEDEDKSEDSNKYYRNMYDRAMEERDEKEEEVAILHGKLDNDCLL